MNSICCTEQEVAGRKPLIRKLIAPIVKDKNHVDVRRVFGADFTIAATRTGLVNYSTVSPDQLRLNTKLFGIYFNYYETWRSVDSVGAFVLERAYFHLYKKPFEHSEDKQILCLHCDPMLKKSDISYVYKSMPHMHVLGAEPNVDRAHLSLCLGNHESISLNIENMMGLMSSAILMIAKEFFPSYERSSNY